MNFTYKAQYYKKFRSFLGKWFKTHSTTLDNLDFFIVASQSGDSDNCGVSNHLLWLWVWKKIIIESWILHIRLSTMRNFGPFWENDLRHTPQLFGILIFLLWHYKMVIMLIKEYPIICFDFGCGENNNKIMNFTYKAYYYIKFWSFLGK